MPVKMQEKSVLIDCLESLKHAAEKYQEAAFECDSDPVRDTLQDIMIDRLEQQAAVFNLMHQMGLYETEAAPREKLERARSRFRDEFGKLEARHREVEGARAAPPDAR